MSLPAGDAPVRSHPIAVALPWVLFSAIILALVCSDLNVNPILDEQQWLQSGLATAHHHLLRTGLVSGPLYGLVLGVLYGVIYLAGRLFGAYSGSLDFVAWYFSHQGFFYFVARGVTAGIATGGLALFARALAPRIGGLSASILALGFAFTVPAIDRIAYATPHGAMIGFSAALIYALVRAREGKSNAGWVAAGAIVAAATSAMTIGPGLALLAFWGAVFPSPAEGGLSRGCRVGLVLAGLVGGLVLFGYPALLHPREYWDSNVRYQIARQILSDEGGRGRLLHDWSRDGLTLWLAGLAGIVWGRFPERRTLAVGAFLTATGYMFFLVVFTRSAQVSYSLAALPCLAYAASGLVEPVRLLKPALRASAVAAILLVPSALAAIRVYQRVSEPHARVIAARRVLETQPAGTTLLVDSWYGPRLLHPRLLLAPYGKAGEEWARDPAFSASLERRLPREQAAWTIVAYPTDLPLPDRGSLRRARIDTVVISRLMMEREPTRAAWESLLKEGTLLPILPEGPGGIRYYRVAKEP
jgi:hypothetical protein